MLRRNIIIGAGVSGLACGCALKDTLVLEKEPVVGGLCRTVPFRGFRFDLGGHRFVTHTPSTERFFRHLLGPQVLEVERRSKIYRLGKFIDYPLRASVIFQLNPIDTALSLSTYLTRKAFPVTEASFRERAINRFGSHLYRLFFRDYTEKVWGVRCDDLSGELVDIRLQNVSLMRVVRHAFLKDRRTKSFTDTFLYPKAGIGALTDALSRGTEVRLNARVTGLVRYGGTIGAVVINNSEELACDSLVSTMPITEIVGLLEPPADVRRAAGKLSYRGVMCVFVILKRERFTRNHWVYFPGKEVFGRLHEPKNWSKDLSPLGRTGVCLEVYCDEGDPLWQASDAQIAHQVIKDLPLVRSFEIEEHCVVRVKHAYPVYGLDYKKGLAAVTRHLSSYRNLFLLGRTGSYRYYNMDTCIEEGLKLGRSLSRREPVVVA